MLQRLICVVIGYACGCVLLSDIVAHRMGGRSAFKLGDGNPGMANVGRELGKKAAILSLLGDILKTVLAVVICHLLFPKLGVAATAWAGLGATLGHVFPIWHGFKGGKGVTTTASTIILMNPLWGILAGVVGVLSIVITSYLSVAAIIAMGFYVIAQLVMRAFEPALVSVIFLIIQLYAHRSKLQGIRTGTTSRAGIAVKVRPKLRK